VAARATAIDDLTVYLALAAFGKRPKFGGLPADIQVDVRTFFRSYRDACSAADDLLFKAGDRKAIDEMCKESRLGKLTPEALYVHAGSVTRLAPLLRVYEGCARSLTGTVEGATLVKLNRLQPKVSYLVYPDFDTDPHPALNSSVLADLAHLRVRFQNFSHSTSQPILHRKETFVPEDYPGRVKFARLTAQEERQALFADPSGIGTKAAWETLVISRGFRFRGHQLVKRSVPSGDSAVSVSDAAAVDPSSLQPKTPNGSMPVPRAAPATRCRHGVAFGLCGFCLPNR
jgi:DNA phosphorothioation-associated putative methyltransferase